MHHEGMYEVPLQILKHTWKSKVLHMWYKLDDENLLAVARLNRLHYFVHYAVDCEIIQASINLKVNTGEVGYNFIYINFISRCAYIAKCTLN